MNMNRIEQLFKDPWTTADPISRQDKPLYICVSGNSGAGKSTLVKLLAEDVYARNPATIAIDEKSLHHPFISKLFFETATYGYQVQLNFMLQRVMLVGYWLDAGYNVVMERSHLEDLVFIRHLLNLGYVNRKEHDAYFELWRCLDERLPHPDLIIFLNVPPEISLVRLHRDEQTGRRPREFPDEETKETWIRSWYRLYLERIDELKGTGSRPIRVVVAGETSDLKDVCSDAMRELQT